MRGLTLLFCCGLALSTVACGGAIDETTSYTDAAEYLYEKGVKSLNGGDYLSATELLTQVKNRYAYSKYAALAELRLADALVMQDRTMEAVEDYRAFMRNRPRHSDVPYAMWRVADCYYREIPKDRFFLPPAYEKDQGPTRDALRNLEAFVRRFPDDEHVPEAKKRIETCLRSLAAYELYVADFYYKSEHFPASRYRLEGVLKDFPKLSGVWEEAANKLLDVYGKLDMKAEADALKSELANRKTSAAQ